MISVLDNDYDIKDMRISKIENDFYLHKYILIDKETFDIYKLTFKTKQIKISLYKTIGDSSTRFIPNVYSTETFNDLDIVMDKNDTIFTLEKIDI